jgi:L-fucose isomerase-like protein
LNSVFDFRHVRSQFIPTGDDFFVTLSAYDKALGSIGGRRLDEASTPGTNPCLYFMDTGGTEQILLDLLDANQGEAPILIIAHPAFNSLPASLEVLARLQQDQIKGRILFLQGPDDRAGLAEIEQTIKNNAVARKLSMTRIGLIGDPSDWLVASKPQADLVQKQWGPEIVNISIDELKQAIEEIELSRLEPTTRSLMEGATEVREPTAEALTDVVRVYEALKQLVQTHTLHALTLRCFDLVLDLNTTGCFALSQLIDEGVVSGCEGDLVSTIGMIWAGEVTGETPWMANPAHLDGLTNSLTLAHCTVPRNLVTDYGLRSHFESGLGVGIQGTIANGPVTLLRIGGKAMEKLWLGEGQIVKAGKDESLCRTQVDIKLSQGNVKELLESPLGNHLVMIVGHHADQLQSSWQTFFPDAV